MADIINLKKALELVGEEKELLKELLESFINDKHFSIEELEALESNEDTTEAAKYVHYFKGAGRQLACEVLAQSGQELEDVLRKKKDGNIPELNKKFLNDYKNAFNAIQEALEIF